MSGLADHFQPMFRAKQLSVREKESLGVLGDSTVWMLVSIGDVYEIIGGLRRENRELKRENNELMLLLSERNVELGKQIMEDVEQRAHVRVLQEICNEKAVRGGRWVFIQGINQFFSAAAGAAAMAAHCSRFRAIDASTRFTWVGGGFFRAYCPQKVLSRGSCTTCGSMLNSYTGMLDGKFRCGWTGGFIPYILAGGWAFARLAGG